jgi:hypothetical protein
MPHRQMVMIVKSDATQSQMVMIMKSDATYTDVDDNEEMIHRNR